MNKKNASFNLKEFLARYSIFIYTGDPIGDFLLIEDEIRELRQLGLIDNEEFMQAMSALRERRNNTS